MWAAAVVSVISTVLQTVSSIQQANASAAQDKDLANQAIQSARTEEFIDRRKSAHIIAKQQAGAAAAGLDIGSGTPLEILMDSAFNAEMNALQIRKKGEMEAMFYKNRARQAKGKIPGLIFGGLSQAAASMFSAFGSMGGGAASSTYSPGTYMYPNSPFPR